MFFHMYLMLDVLIIFTFYPSVLKVYVGIVFTYLNMLDGRATGQWESLVPGFISETI